MTALYHRLFELALRNDFMAFLWKVFATIDPATTFLPNWHHEAIWHICQDAIEQRASRDAICAPPRSGKSIILSVALPAWLLGHDPTRKIVCISYNNDIAAKFANDFRAVIEAAWFRKTFPTTIVSKRKNTESETIFTAGGYRLGTSISGGITGRGGDTVICDDPLKAQDASSDVRRENANQTLQSTIISRLDDKKKGSIIIGMQRLHANDFVGSLGEDWSVHNFPAIAIDDETVPVGSGRHYCRKIGEPLHDAREPLWLLEQIRNDVGPDVFDAQYQQTPAPPGGLIVKKEWIHYHEGELPRWGYYLLSWDTAGKAGPRNSYSVCTVWYRKDSTHYLVDVVRGRFDYPTLRDTAVQLIKKYKPRVVLVEEASTGVALAADLRGTPFCTVVPVPVVGDKIGRLYNVTGKFASRNVFFPKEAPFTRVLLEELLRFPQVKFTDQVDSISQALAYEGSTYTLAYIR